MKKTSVENIKISNLIGDVIGVSFKNEEFSLDNWGEVDNWAQLSDGTLILIEYEKGQKHPNTNVLKLYPYLEENPSIKIVLVHYFYQENKTPKNRLALCEFVSKRMEKEFIGRFKYIYLDAFENDFQNKKTELTELLLSVKTNL